MTDKGVLNKKEDSDLNKKILALIEKYANKHTLAKACGGEYIYQSDSAQVDAIKLVSSIFDLYSRRG